MDKYEARAFVCLVADTLKLPSFVCEIIEQKLIEEKYEEVVKYCIQRKKEIYQK